MRRVEKQHVGRSLNNSHPRRSRTGAKFNGASKEIAFVWLVSFICLSGASYQTFISLRNFFVYPSIVSATFDKEAAEFPAVTICPENWYNMTQVCQWWPNNCTKKDVLLIYAVAKATSMNEFREYGQPTLDQLFKCAMISRSEVCESFNCSGFFRKAYFKVPMRYCYVFDSGQIPKSHPYHHCPSPWLYELQVDLVWNETYMKSFFGVGSIPVYVHQPFTNPPVAIEALSMLKGSLIEASVTQRTTIRLPLPYGTNCEAYQATALRPEWGGYTTFAGCIQECQMQLEFEICGCVMGHHEYSVLYGGRLCEYRMQKDCQDAMTASGTGGSCQEKCHLACRETTYDCRLSGLIQYAPDVDESIHRSSLHLSFASSSVERSVYTPATESDKTWAQISGFIGIWLGASVHQFAEMVAEKCLARFGKRWSNNVVSSAEP